jgi:hypothetical protein
MVQGVSLLQILGTLRQFLLKQLTDMSMNNLEGGHITDTDFSRVFETLFSVGVESQQMFRHTDKFEARHGTPGWTAPKLMVLRKYLGLVYLFITYV